MSVTQLKQGEPNSVYRTSPIKRKRRTRAEIDAVRERLWHILDADHPMTVRQVFYRAVILEVIDKTEREYKSTVIRLLSELRLAGLIPFDWIADNTRWQRKPTTYSSLEQALRYTAQAYRRSLWDNQDVHVEVWLEKDALAGVLYEETGSWDVPLMVTRGYPSLSFLHGAANYIATLEKPTYLYYFGDYDPSGVDISRNVEQRLREFAPDADIEFERVAVNPDQIIQLNLPTRPTKKTDSRLKGFQGESVEVDAIPVRTLRDMTAGCITRHIDENALEVQQLAEADERRALEMFVDSGAWKEGAA